MNQKTKQALYIILTALLFAAILLVLLPFLLIWLIFTTHPISFLIASIFIIGEIIFGFIKVVQYITNKSQKTPSKFKTIFRRTWLAVGIGAILAQPLLYGIGDPDSVPGSGRSPEEGNGKPLQYPCLEYSMNRGAWQAIVHGVAKSQTQAQGHVKAWAGM